MYSVSNCKKLYNPPPKKTKINIFTNSLDSLLNFSSFVFMLLMISGVKIKDWPRVKLSRLLHTLSMMLQTSLVTFLSNAALIVDKFKVLRLGPRRQGRIFLTLNKNSYLKKNIFKNVNIQTSLEQELSISHTLKFSIPYIFAT